MCQTEKNISRISSINAIKILIYCSEAGTILIDRDISITHRERQTGALVAFLLQTRHSSSVCISSGPVVDRIKVGRR